MKMSIEQKLDRVVELAGEAVMAEVDAGACRTSSDYAAARSARLKLEDAKDDLKKDLSLAVARQSLADLVNALESQASPGSTYHDGPCREVVSMTNPLIVSAMQQARLVLRGRPKH